MKCATVAKSNFFHQLNTLYFISRLRRGVRAAPRTRRSGEARPLESRRTFMASPYMSRLEQQGREHGCGERRGSLAGTLVSKAPGEEILGWIVEFKKSPKWRPKPR